MSPKCSKDTSCTTIASSVGNDDGDSGSGEEGMRHCHPISVVQEGRKEVDKTGPKDTDDDGENEEGLPPSAGAEASRPQQQDSEIEEVSGFAFGSDHEPTAETRIYPSPDVFGRGDEHAHGGHAGEVQQSIVRVGGDDNGTAETGMEQSRTEGGSRTAEKSSPHPQNDTSTSAVSEKEPLSDPAPTQNPPPSTSSSRDASTSGCSSGVERKRRGRARDVQPAGGVADGIMRADANDDDERETETGPEVVSTEESRRNAGESSPHQQGETDITNISDEQRPSVLAPTAGQPQGQEVERRLSLPGAHRIRTSWVIHDRDSDDEGETEQPGTERLRPAMLSSSSQRESENTPEDSVVPVREPATLPPCIEASIVHEECIVDATPVDEEEGSTEEIHRQKIESLKRGQKRTFFLASAVLVILASAAAIAVVKIAQLPGGVSNDEVKTEGIDGGGMIATARVDDPDRMDSMRGVVAPLSGEDAFDPNSPVSSPDRIAALDWLVRNDPAQLPADDPDLEWKIRQRYVLALFFISTNGPEWFDQYNFLSGRDECEWNRALSRDDQHFFSEAVEVKGVVCDLQRRVQMLKLWWENLSGTLPHELSYLSESLVQLNLHGGSISSTIPSSFGDLTDLHTLTLAEHCLSGTIPESLSRLSILSVGTFWGNSDLAGSLNGFCSGTDYRNSETDVIIADCGDCPGSRALIECSCCRCCDGNSFDCCDKEGNAVWKYHNLNRNPVSGEPLSFDKHCLSKEALLWRQEECPCVEYEEDDSGQCTMECDP